jgi:hypothetical protein
LRGGGVVDVQFSYMYKRSLAYKHILAGMSTNMYVV